MDRSQTQLGDRKTRPWVGLRLLWGEAESRLWGFRPGPGVRGNCWDPGQPSEVSSPGRPCTQNTDSREAAYQRGCPMSSTLFR